MIDSLNEDYVRTARAKGLGRTHGDPTARAARGHRPGGDHLRLDFAGLLVGTIFTEKIFGIQGIGLTGRGTCSAPTCPLVSAVTLMAAAFIVLANIVVDILYSVIDPRVRCHDPDHEPASHRDAGHPTEPTAGDAPFLVVEDLTVRFPTADGLVQAVSGLSYTIEQGRTLGIVGESGSGKSVSSLAVMGLARRQDDADVGLHPAWRQRDPRPVQRRHAPDPRP
jgi:ABC-type transport system involved in cytochrome bd biosynthesis fused ATPase/permease subunit